MGKKKTRFKNAFGWSRFLLGEGSLPSFTSSSFERESRITMRSVVVVSTPFLRSSSSSLFPRWGKQDSRHGRLQKKVLLVKTGRDARSSFWRRRRRTATEEVNTTRTRRRRNTTSRDGSARRRSSPRWFFSGGRNRPPTR